MRGLTCLPLLLLPLAVAADDLPTMTQPEMEQFLGRPLTSHEAWVTSPEYARRLQLSRWQARKQAWEAAQSVTFSPGTVWFLLQEDARLRYHAERRWYEHSPTARPGDLLRVFDAWADWQATLSSTQTPPQPFP